MKTPERIAQEKKIIHLFNTEDENQTSRIAKMVGMSTALTSKIINQHLNNRTYGNP